jgi:hypothetical protein
MLPSFLLYGNSGLPNTPIAYYLEPLQTVLKPLRGSATAILVVQLLHLLANFGSTLMRYPAMLVVLVRPYSVTRR